MCINDSGVERDLFTQRVIISIINIFIVFPVISFMNSKGGSLGKRFFRIKIVNHDKSDTRSF